MKNKSEKQPDITTYVAITAGAREKMALGFRIHKAIIGAATEAATSKALSL
jgi:hypothetical protein